MKKAIGLVLILALCLLSAAALADGGTVTATGTGTVTLVPDMASFSAGITTQDALVTMAQAANSAAMQAVLDTLRSLGVSGDDLRTDSYSVYPVYNYDTSTPTVTGYEVSNTVTVVVRDLDQLPSLLDAAVEAGANNVYSLSFQSSEQPAAYEQALKAAAQDALRKAALIAQAIGREAGDTLSLTEISSASEPYYGVRAYAMESSFATPIESGLISVSAEVQSVVEMK
jgi:uncharacterized protein YggE